MPEVCEWTYQVSHQFQQLAPRRDLYTTPTAKPHNHDNVKANP